ncbi:hypothetical protein DSM07_07295 [Oenococcus sp. UCMA 16435]|nr:hypothetical protein DSM07_07295 [Oenococcus sp. UCMA 16435]MDI4584602.1 hypothetical protein [Oenococcus sp. UCMA 14587]
MLFQAVFHFLIIAKKEAAKASLAANDKIISITGRRKIAEEEISRINELITKSKNPMMICIDSIAAIDCNNRKRPNLRSAPLE